jgi:fructose-specific component phosphotransferase system IIB-like protein
MSRSNPYNEYIKKLEKRQKKDTNVSDEIGRWRKKYRKLGPVRFAEEILTCPPDVPSHPDLADEYYPDGRVPEFVILEEFQKDFLEDMAEATPSTINQLILSAGRGGGKTFCIAIYVCWRISCFDYFTLTVMGGSSDQSNKIKEYIDFWRMTVTEINYCLYRSVGSSTTAATVFSRWGGYSRFPACSESSARGPHVTQLMVDEVCVGESKSKGGAMAVRSARGQLTSSPRSLLVYTSTAHYIFGTFYRTWRDYEKLGWKRIRWSIAKYYEDDKWYKKADEKFVLDQKNRKILNWNYIDTVLIRDRDPYHWISNVWWITDNDIQNMRRNQTDDEFLVECLGGISRGSGLVFSRADLRACICRGDKFTSNGEECVECNPYDPKKCPFMKKMGWDGISLITDRKVGVDFGEIAPNAVTVVGRIGKKVYVLYSQERIRDTESVLRWIQDKATEYKIHQILADPESRAMRDALHNKGYSVPHLWGGGGGGKKEYYATNFKRFVEKHLLFIPMAFVQLETSLSELSYDNRGKIRKDNDHSFDSCMYGMSEYDVDAHGDSFWKTKDRGVTIW